MLIGGTGFFGKSFLDAYNRKLLAPWDIDGILVVARNATLLRVTHPHLLSDSISLIDLDISSCQELPYAKFVIHAATSADATDYLLKPLDAKNNILKSVSNYCELARKFHHNSHIVYCSSGAVYGCQDPASNRLIEGSIFSSLEGMPHGKRDYASAKRDAEMEFQKLASAGVNTIIARCFAFVGPYLARDKHFAIGNFIEDGLRCRPIKIASRHMVLRSYMYADDLVLWLMTLANNSSINCEIFNVGSDQAISLIDLAHKIADYFNVQTQIPPIESSFIDRYIPSIDKAKYKFGLTIGYDLDASLRATIDEICS